jgi:hypothetical protein
MKYNNNFEQLAYLEGYKRGFNIGFQEGKECEALLIAKNLSKYNAPFSLIQLVTGLSKEEILKNREKK